MGRDENVIIFRNTEKMYESIRLFVEKLNCITNSHEGV